MIIKTTAQYIDSGNVNDIDFTTEINEITEEIATIFTEGTSKEVVQQNINLLRSQIKTLINIINLAFTKDKRTLIRQNYTEISLKAYELVMIFRKFLTGEEVVYQLYIRGDNMNDARVVTLTGEEMMEYVERNGDTLRLKKNLDTIDQMKNNDKVQRIFDKHFEQISKSFHMIKDNNFVVPIDEIPDVASHPSERPNLYWQDLKGPRGKSAYTPKMFNRGRIYEAFAGTAFDLYGKNYTYKEGVDAVTFRRQFFINNLVSDNVKGFKGGDVGLSQVKATCAELMNLNTIRNYLIIIDQILSPENWENKKRLKEFIKSEFTDTTKKKLPSSINRTINKSVKNLFNNF